MVTLNDVIGEEQIIDYFRQAVLGGTVSHAYVLEGEEGAGKKMLAYAFAKLLQCEEGKESACGKCKSCLMAESMNHPDIITVTHSSPMHFGVDELRTQMVNEMGMPGLANMILLGAVIAKTGCIDEAGIEDALKKVIPARKMNLLEANMNALEAGKNYVQ